MKPAWFSELELYLLLIFQIAGFVGFVEVFVSYPLRIVVSNPSQEEVGENGYYEDHLMGVVPAEVHHLVVVPADVDLMKVVSAEVHHLGFYH